MARDSKFKFQVIGRFDPNIPGNDSHVFLSVLAGDDWDHLSLCGTLTMSEPQWQTFSDALRDAIGDSIELENLRVH